MKKRLRRKKYIGEFKVIAYNVNVEYTNIISSECIDSFLNDIIDFVEHHNVSLCGSCCGECFSGAIYYNIHAQPSRKYYINIDSVFIDAFVLFLKKYEFVKLVNVSDSFNVNK